MIVVDNYEVPSLIDTGILEATLVLLIATAFIKTLWSQKDVQRILKQSCNRSYLKCFGTVFTPTA